MGNWSSKILCIHLIIYCYEAIKNCVEQYKCLLCKQLLCKMCVMYVI